MFDGRRFEAPRGHDHANRATPVSTQGGVNGGMPRVRLRRPADCNVIPRVWVADTMTTYDAFISYSHARDKPIAAALQTTIQKLGKPWYRRRALRVFRDDTSLSATPHLWPSIEGALNDSRYLILLTSPEAAASHWVSKEVAHWLDRRGVDTLLIGVTDGELKWDQRAGDFVWKPGTTPLPDILKGRFGTEPKWVDLRAFRDGADRAPQLQDLAADFAAAIHGIPKEDLLSKEVQQQRRALALAWSTSAVLAALIALAGWQWWEATSAKTLAQQQRDQIKTVLSQSDLDQASQLLLRSEPSAKPLALLSRAVRTAGNETALTKIWMLLQNRSFWIPSRSPADDVGPKAPVAAKPANDVPAAVKRKITAAITSSAVSSDGQLVFTAIGGGVAAQGSFQWRIWNRNGTPVTDWIEPKYEGDFYLYDIRAFFSPDSRYLALELYGWRESSYVEVFDLGKKALIPGTQREMRANGKDPQRQNRGFGIIKFVPCPAKPARCDGALLLLGADRGGASAFRLAEQTAISVSPPHEHDAPITALDVDQNQQWFMSGSADGKMQVTSLGGDATFPETLELGAAPTALRRQGNQLIARLADGKTKAFQAVPPIEVSQEPAANGWADPGRCISRQNWKAPGVLFDAKAKPSSGGTGIVTVELKAFEPRRIDLNLTDASGRATTASRTFGADIEFICANASTGRHVVVGLTGFLTQVWTSDLSTQVGPTFNEHDLMNTERRPDRLSAAFLSPDGRTLAVKTTLWFPPNVQGIWYGIWDIQTGIPLSDRIEFIDDFSDVTDDADVDSVSPGSALFSTDGSRLAFKRGCADGNCKFLKIVDLLPPASLRARVPEIAEAMGGVRYNQQGLLEPVPEDERAKAIAALRAAIPAPAKP